MRLFIGLNTYVKRKRYIDPVLLKLAVEFCTFLSDIVTFQSGRPFNRCIFYMNSFINGMWESLRALEPSNPDDSQLAVWTEIFKIYCILQR